MNTAYATAPRSESAATQRAGKAPELLLSEGVLTHSAHFRWKNAYLADPVSVLAIVKTGLPAATVFNLALDMKKPNEWLYRTVGISRSTVERKARRDTPLSAAESSKVLGLARLVGQAQLMVEESGDPEGFDAAAWVAQWLDQPLAALAGVAPGTFMDTTEGQAIVSSLLARAQSGAYT